MTDTCINYQTIQAPIYNEHVAFGDTGVVIYSNSICGARSNFEGGPSALAAGITGRTPRYGFHLPEGRRATLKIRAEFTPIRSTIGGPGGRDRAHRRQLLGRARDRGYPGDAEIGSAQAFRCRDGELWFHGAVSYRGTDAGSATG